MIGVLAALTVFPLAMLSVGSDGGGPAAAWLGGWVSIPRVSFLLFGMCSFAPHVLIGLAAREWVHPKAGSTAGGLVKFMAQFGGACAGGPFGLVIDRYGWEGGLHLLCVRAVVAGMVMVPLLSQTARVEDARAEIQTRSPEAVLVSPSPSRGRQGDDGEPGLAREKLS